MGLITSGSLVQIQVGPPILNRKVVHIMKPRNYVAKNAYQSNKADVFDDKKRKLKKGYKKHKQALEAQNRLQENEIYE